MHKVEMMQTLLLLFPLTQTLHFGQVSGYLVVFRGFKGAKWSKMRQTKFQYGPSENGSSLPLAECLYRLWVLLDFCLDCPQCSGNSPTLQTWEHGAGATPLTNLTIFSEPGNKTGGIASLNTKFLMAIKPVNMKRYIFRIHIFIMI